MPYNYLNTKTTRGTRIQIKTFGQWNQAVRELQLLSPAIKEASIQAQLSVLNDIKKIVKGHLKNQDLFWAPLNDEYALRKRLAGFSGNILGATGSYQKNIDTWRSGNRHMAFMGVRRGIYTRETNGKRSRIDIATIAYIHEMSSGKRIPKRPLWNPSIAEYGGAKGIKRNYILALHKYLRKAGLRHITTKFTINSVFG